jgi:hypothetical protein
MKGKERNVKKILSNEAKKAVNYQRWLKESNY